MPVEWILPAADFQIGEGERAKPSSSAPGRQKLTGLESIALFDLLDFHRFLLKETRLKDASASSEETGRIEASGHCNFDKLTNMIDPCREFGEPR
jgi:hypothetical protein